jgi:predicted amidophosphoribosyltransferase
MLRLPGVREELLDLVFPARCAGCGGHGKVLCDSCLAALAGLATGEPVGQLRHPCPTGRPAFSGFRAAGVYGGLIKEMVLRLKSSARPFAAPLARLMIAAAGNEPEYLAADRIFCVPSERAKLLQRGYNPAELLARAVAHHLDRPLENCLEKTRRTSDQDGLSGSGRWENVTGAFTVLPGTRLSGRALLIDDVLTTGATADSCSRALMDAGADSVRVLVAARAIMRSRWQA